MLVFATVQTAYGVSLEAREGTTLVGQITAVEISPTEYDLNHTGVFPEFEGRGYGRQLVHAAVEWARARQVRLQASCPYARKLLDRTPEHSDVAVPNPIQ